MPQGNNPPDEERTDWDDASRETEIDPVCGMEVDRGTAAGASHFDGTRYYFCSEECKLSFDASPDEYVGTSTGNARP
jgi:YHS domain-containing protein